MCIRDRYLSIEQLSELTPWSCDAIRSKMKRGEFAEKKHFFRPNGLGSRPVFRWSAVVEYIEGGPSEGCVDDAVALSDGTMIYVRAKS